MSGGEQQRIALAAAYTQNPDIYVLDEPSANLDEQEILRLQQLLGQLKRQGKSILIAEHRTWYLKDLIDQAIFLAAGEMARQWTGADFAQLTPAACAYWGLRSVQRVKCCVKPACAAKEGAAGLPAKSTKGLSVRQLSVKRQQRYLCTDLSFEMPRGQVVVLQGCNGAGKSSLARVLCGLNKAQAGQIYLDGKKLGPRALRQKSFMIMQEVNYQLFSDSVLAQARLGNHCSEAEALRVLTELQLEGLIQRHPLSLSGGQKQRLAIAVGCLCQKELILLDEPTSGLDWRNMQRVVGLLRGLQQQDKMLLVITHDLEFIQALHPCNCLQLG